MNIKKKRLIQSLGAAATAIALALGGSVAAFAAPTTIDPAKEVNLNIVKLSTPDGSALEPTGQEQTLPGGSTTIGGVEFTVRQITNAGDLKTNSGWQEASQVDYNAATGEWTKSDDPFTPDFSAAAPATQVAVTDADGIPRIGAVDGDGYGTGATAYQTMPIGLYFVEETATPAGVTPAAPFVVALPMTNPTSLKEWLYTVHVYPKNSEATFIKTVDDSAAYVPGVTNNVVWTLNADVPRVNTSSDPDTPPVWATPTAFTINDVLDNRLAEVDGTNVAVKITDGAGGDLGNQPVVATDYVVTIIPPTAAVGEAQTVNVAFEGTGFDLLQRAAATPNAKVVVTITTQTEAPELPATLASTTEGVITNSATFSTTVTGSTTELTSNEVQTIWRDITFTKVNDADVAEELEGAVFGLFVTEDDAIDAIDANDVTLAIATSAPTGVGGQVLIPNVRISNHENGILLTDPDDYRVYWLAETVAPDGYELLAEPIPVVLLDDGAVVELDVALGGEKTAIGNVVNVPQNAGFVLPLTGGMGTALLTIAGIAILATVLFVARRRRDTELSTE